LKIATWNVNSIKARLPNALEWLKESAPDVALLQEIKVVDEAFPELELGDLGYNVAVHGQKTYNGVAILSKLPLEDVVRGLPGDDDDTQARYIEASVGGVRVASIYLPNGNPVDSEKYPYKLAWMDRLRARARALLDEEHVLVLGGDYNVCPTDADVYDPERWAGDALCRPESRAAFRALLHLGFTEAYHALHPGTVGRYTFWDYQGGAWQKDHGLRIDHLLLSPQAADRLGGCEIERAVRGKTKASDHVPIWCEIAA
jgi:exodeoxyribonuclease-3